MPAADIGQLAESLTLKVLDRTSFALDGHKEKHGLLTMLLVHHGSRTSARCLANHVAVGGRLARRGR